VYDLDMRSVECNNNCEGYPFSAFVAETAPVAHMEFEATTALMKAAEVAALEKNEQMERYEVEGELHKMIAEAEGAAPTDAKLAGYAAISSLAGDSVAASEAYVSLIQDRDRKLVAHERASLLETYVNRCKGPKTKRPRVLGFFPNIFKKRQTTCGANSEGIAITTEGFGGPDLQPLLRKPFQRRTS
jgi:hypothetical protein